MFLFLFFSLIFLQIATAAEYTPINYVSDYAEIIDEDYEAQINTLAREIERNTSVEIAVLTVSNLDGDDIDQFAVKTFHDWGVGKKDIDNGLLMVIAIEDREWRIEVGYGLEPVITDSMAGRIGRAHFVENFRAGEYGKGIHGAVLDVQKIIGNDPTAISAYSDSGAEITELKEFGRLSLSVSLFVVLTLIYGYFCRWVQSRYARGYKSNESRSKESSAVQSVDTKSAKVKAWLGPPKILVVKLMVLLVFSLIVWYFSNWYFSWILSVNFFIVNIVRALSWSAAGRIHGGGLGRLGGGRSGGGFGGFGGGSSGGGGASGRW